MNLYEIIFEKNIYIDIGRYLFSIFIHQKMK